MVKSDSDKVKIDALPKVDYIECRACFFDGISVKFFHKIMRDMQRSSDELKRLAFKLSPTTCLRVIRYLKKSCHS